jgi:predicted transcriptional regulator
MNSKIIYNHCLSNNKYDIKTLETNINRLSLKKLLNTQRLTYDFCIKYLLHPEEYAMCQEDYNITIEDIKLYQSHLYS